MTIFERVTYVFKKLLCFFGLHEPMKYITVGVRGKEFRKCRNCGKLLDEVKGKDTLRVKKRGDTYGLLQANRVY